jgi:hypothetical protein
MAEALSDQGNAKEGSEHLYFSLEYATEETEYYRIFPRE